MPTILVKGFLSGAIVLLICLDVTPVQAGDSELLKQYCVGCHNERGKSRYANLSLEAVDPEQAATSPQLWEKVVRKLQLGAMPPAGARRPGREEVAAFVSHLQERLDAAPADPGRPAAHRLNRTEYRNAIRDLVGLDLDPRPLLPPDDSAYGFDNVADVLTVSPALIERYLGAAKKIVALALGLPEARALQSIYKVSPLLLQDDRLYDDAPFGTRGGLVASHLFPSTAVYRFTIRLQRAQSMTGEVRGRTEPNDIQLSIDGEQAATFNVPARAVRPTGYTHSEDGFVKVELPVRAGQRRVVVSIARRPDTAREGVGPLRMPVASTVFQSAASTDGVSVVRLGVDGLEVDGPLSEGDASESPTRQRLMTCAPARPSEEERCARAILEPFARRAYRRPLTVADTSDLLVLYRQGRLRGGFDRGVALALERVLTAPDFLFRVEGQPSSVRSGEAYRISGLELASRLSFFLWSSIPDEPLLVAAERGQLTSETGLRTQVQRMLADERAVAWRRNFFGQWLWLRNVLTGAPNPQLFPEFNGNLGAAFLKETELFIDSQVNADRPVTELLTARYSFVNADLARHYGISGVYGSRFRRVDLIGERAGLLGQASVLMVTSYAHRTSPVKRGKWLLENLLGAPPPNPPPGVPPFPESDGLESLSVRQRMEKHRANPVCSTCHASMDPLGFSLENFDAIGRWRSVDGAGAVDASGVLPDGTKFSGPSEFRAALLERQEAFLSTVVERLLTYSLGRGVEATDMPAVRTILRRARAEDFRWSSVVMGVVDSVPFRQRRAE